MKTTNEPTVSFALTYRNLRILFFVGFALKTILVFVPSLWVRYGGEVRSLTKFEVIRLMFQSGQFGWAVYNLFMFCVVIAFAVLALNHPRRWVFLTGSCFTIFTIGFTFVSTLKLKANQEIGYYFLPELLGYIGMAMCLVGFWVKPPDTAVATLDVVNSEPVTPSQPPTEVTATCKSRSLIHAIVRWVIIGGATTVVTVLAIFAPGIIEQLKKSHSGSTSGSNSSSSDYPHTARSSHKSDRTLIRDYAECHYTHIRSIDIDSFTDGSYQVKIIMDSGPGYLGYKANTYTAKVDESAQQVTSWQLTASD